jgi:ABC-type multidrug transport system ATPase subunit
VAILRDGMIVALDRPAELAGNGAAQTLVSFRLPPGVAIEAARANLSVPVELSGGVASLRAKNPQRALYELTSWAERERVELIGLEATRPTLEDIFLESTGGGDE